MTRRTLRLSIFINLVILAGLLVFFIPTPENQADSIMQDLIYGNYDAGTPSGSILFSNFIIGSVLAGLRQLIPIFPWYVIYHILCCLLALVIICALMLERSTGYTGRLLLASVTVYTAYECYIGISYLKTAGILAIAAVFLLLYVIRPDSVHSKVGLALSALTGILGCLTGFFAYAAVFMGSALLVIIYIAIAKIFEDRRTAIIAIGKAAAISIVILAIGAALYLADTMHYKHNPSLSADYRYRLSLEKCLSCGVLFDDGEVSKAVDSVYAAGALDPDLIDVYESLAVKARSHMLPDIHEAYNFLRFESQRISEIPMIYLWFFLAYILCMYGSRRERIAVAVSACAGILCLFAMRLANALLQNWMYTLEIMPFIFFDALFFEGITYRHRESGSETADKVRLAVNVFFIVFLAYYLFGDAFSSRFTLPPLK